MLRVYCSFIVASRGAKLNFYWGGYLCNGTECMLKRDKSMFTCSTR